MLESWLRSSKTLLGQGFGALHWSARFFQWLGSISKLFRYKKQLRFQSHPWKIKIKAQKLIPNRKNPSKPQPCLRLQRSSSELDGSNKKARSLVAQGVRNWFKHHEWLITYAVLMNSPHARKTDLFEQWKAIFCRRKKSFIRNEFHEASIKCRNYANMLHSFVQSERWEIWTNNPTKSIALLT